jgi:hypothetical protein
MQEKNVTHQSIYKWNINIIIQSAAIMPLKVFDAASADALPKKRVMSWILSQILFMPFFRVINNDQKIEHWFLIQ